MFRKILLSTLVAASFGGVSMGAISAPIFATVAPPPPREEAMPAPRHGKAWQAGHYAWRNHNYVWVPGTFVAERRGKSYEAAHWVERNGRWYMEPGRWVTASNPRDRDGDGVPNRVDRAPNNPNRS